MHRQTTPRTAKTDRRGLPCANGRIGPANLTRTQKRPNNAHALIARPSAGLLIPKLDRGIPLAVSLAPKNKQTADSALRAVDWERHVVETMLEMKILKHGDQFSDLNDAIEAGFRNLLPPVVRDIDYEDDTICQVTNYGENPLIFGTEVDSRPRFFPFYFGVLHRRLEKIATATRIKQIVTWGLSVCLNSPLIGCPYVWKDIDGYSPGKYDSNLDDYVEDENTSVAFQDYIKGPLKTLDSAKYARFSRSQVQRIHRALQKHAPKLGTMLEAIHASTISIGRDAPDGCLCIACWSPRDLIDHGWDFMEHMIANGDLDCNDPPMFSMQGSVQVIAGELKKFGDELTPVYRLQRWLLR